MTCALCGGLLALDNQDPDFPQLCRGCGRFVGIDQPATVPDEFADDGTQDFTEEDVVT